jgi:Transposase DDE domain
MEHQLWTAIVAAVAALDKPPARRRLSYSDEEVVGVFYWAVVHDRPVAWAVRRENWPPHLRARRRPSNAAMSRRLRTPSVQALLAALERRVTAPADPGGVFWAIDGKPLVIGGCSKDRQAGYGRAAGGKAKGYKLHAIVGAGGRLAAWRVAPMNADERVMAARMLKATAAQGYFVADSNYDSNALHAICDARGDRQLVTRRRYGPGHGFGHNRQTAGRLRSVGLTEGPFPAFAAGLLRDRAAVERAFGHLVNWGGGLTGLPAWVRTHRRVYRWVQAKLTLAALKLTEPIRSYVA